jgi:hypothetical protein
MIGPYVDRRRAGRPRYSTGLPRDGLMRIPQDLLNVTVFLGGRDDRGDLHYRATAVCVAMPSVRQSLCTCLVTAKHNIVKAEATYGNVWVRINDRSGGAIDIEISEPWTYADTASCDLAAVPFPGLFLLDTTALPVPTEWFATADVIANRGVGPGDELVVMGLFSNHIGKERNLPIVRSGNIASMPQEPLEDPKTGEPYDAYLAEVRSIGGLSGSPAFIVLNPDTRMKFGDEAIELSGKPFYLLGLIRGHWNRDAETDFADEDFGEGEREQLNTGIAIVTPITELLRIFEQERFVAYRDSLEAAYARDHDQVEDSAIEAETPGEASEFGNFDALASAVVKVPKSEIDAKRGKQ